MLRVIASLIAAAIYLVAPAQAETTRLRYQAAVLGVVEVGEITYEATSSAEAYNARATVRTSGVAALFDQTQITASASGVISGASIGWTAYDLQHAYANKSRRTHMARSGSAVTTQITPRYGNLGDPAASTAQQSSSYDPLSGIFALGRQVGARRGCMGEVLIFDGRQHYRLSVTPKTQGTYNGGGYNGPGVGCNMRYEPISGFSAGSPRAATVAEAWFAMPEQPGFAAPLRITVPTPLGNAQLEVRSFETTP